MEFLMECQPILTKYKINKEKNIGKVLVLVEGENTEFKVLNRIFHDLLGYTTYNYRRKSKTSEFVDKCYKGKNNNSLIYIANLKNSDMKELLNEKEKDKILNKIQDDLGQSLKNIRTYIIWDRDNLSNTSIDTKKALLKYGSSLDNGVEANGILLLNYPCVEVYPISILDRYTYQRKYKTSQEAKSYLKEKKNHLTSEKDLLHALRNMHISLKNKIKIEQYETDNFQKTNLEVFHIEEQQYEKDNKYLALSLISIMLIDLGIIEEKELK